jgi:hypothetical protein
MLFDLPFDYIEAMAAWLCIMAVLFFGLLRLRRRFSRSNRARLVWANAGLSLWMLASMLTLVELYFAIGYDQSDSFNMTNVSKHWYQRHISHSQRALRFTDGQQTVFRDDHDFPRSLEAGLQHIVFVGDSFTFGHGIRRTEDRFSNLIGAELAHSQPGRFVVTNIADAGTEPHWVETLLKSVFAERLPVHTVVYVVCLNDIETFDKRYKDMSGELGSHFPTNFLLKDTYFFNLVYFRMKQASIAGVRDYYSYLQDSYTSEAWNGMRAKFEDVRQLCADNGAELRMVVFPFLHNLGSDYPFGEAHRRIAEYCRESQIKFLDLKDVLEPHASAGLTVNRFDAHPNEKAHALAAEAIRQRLLADLVEMPQETENKD